MGQTDMQERIKTRVKHLSRVRIRGFTVIELMVTVVVLAIVLSLGVPSFRQFIINNRVTGQANTLMASLNIARSEAINRAENVSVTATSGTNWHLGWTVATSGGTTLRNQGAFEGDSTLVGTANSLTYTSSGFLSGSAVSFNLCNSGATSERQIAVTPGGRANLHASFTCP